MKWLKAAFGVCASITVLAFVFGHLGLSNETEVARTAYPVSSVFSEVPPITAPLVASLGETVGVPRVVIPVCAPERISSPTISLDARVYKMTSADVNGSGDVDPRYFDAVAFDSEVGSAPGTDAKNTTYLYGHSSYVDNVVFNHLNDLSVGDKVYIDTCSEKLTFVVEDMYTVLKPDLAKDPRFRIAQPGRVNLVACYRAKGNERFTTENIVVQLQLSKS